MTPTTIRDQLRHHILDTYLHGEDPDQLADDDNLFEAGVLDSMALQRLVLYLADRYAIRVEPEDYVFENLGTVGCLAAYVARKTGAPEARAGAST